MSTASCFHFLQIKSSIFINIIVLSMLYNYRVFMRIKRYLSTLTVPVFGCIKILDLKKQVVDFWNQWRKLTKMSTVNYQFYSYTLTLVLLSPSKARNRQNISLQKIITLISLCFFLIISECNNFLKKKKYIENYLL